MTVTGVIVLIGFVLGSISQGDSESLMDAQTRLLNDLFQKATYDKRVIPLHNESEPITLRLGIRLLNIDKLYEHEDVLETGLHIQQIWYDFRLAWNPANYQRLHVIHIPVEDLWKPDIYLFNNAEAQMDSMDALAIVFNSGHVYFSPKVRVKSRCQVDLTKFPYDTQECVIKIGSFTYDGQRLNLIEFQENNTFDMSDYETSKEWSVVGRGSRVITKKHSCCQELYPYMQFTLQLQRESIYFTYVFVLPAVLLALLVPFQFLIPPDSRERISLGTLLLLACLLLLALLQSFLPSAHTELPHLVQYYCLTILWTVLALINSIFVINIHTRGPRKKKVPNVVRQVFLKALRRLVCLNDESYLPLEEVEAMSYKALDKPQTMQPDHVTSDSNKLERDVEEILRQLNTLVSRSVLGNGRAYDWSEWYQVAVVMDRIIFFVFIVIFTIYSLALL